MSDGRSVITRSTSTKSRSGDAAQPRVEGSTSLAGSTAFRFCNASGWRNVCLISFLISLWKTAGLDPPRRVERARVLAGQVADPAGQLEAVPDQQEQAAKAASPAPSARPSAPRPRRWNSSGTARAPARR